jgi:hypothetical protein
VALTDFDVPSESNLGRTWVYEKYPVKRGVPTDIPNMNIRVTDHGNYWYYQRFTAEGGPVQDFPLPPWGHTQDAEMYWDNEGNATCIVRRYLENE